jgi:glycosyltransferase domain-containing protein
MENKNFIWQKKITILIHTKNRPAFLFRLLDYYNEKIGSTSVFLIILDGSNEENYLIINKEIKTKKYQLNINFLHHDSQSTLTLRLAEALQLIATPYVLLAADDDFYFFDWLKLAVELLDSDLSYGVVYGYAIQFELESYTPYGNLVKLGYKKPNPPMRWLEDENPFDRLKELGKSNWATTGWYALQRTEILSTIVKIAYKNELVDYHLERLLIFCQATLKKTKRTDHIFLARQSCNIGRPRYSLKAEKEDLKKLIKICEIFLEKYLNVELKIAKIVVDNVFKPEIASLRKNDSLKYLTIIGDYFPYLRKIKNTLHLCFKGKNSRVNISLEDARFRGLPEISYDYQKVLDIKKFTKLIEK